MSESDAKETSNRQRNLPLFSGILAVDIGSKEASFGNSMMTASYVYMLLSAGASVVPLPLSMDVTAHRELFRQINGLFVPGGFVTPLESKVLRVFYNYARWAVAANQQGDYFPIWGTCLGFELLLLSFSNRSDVLEKCDVQNELLILSPTKHFTFNRMFRGASPHLLEAMQREPLAPNFHQWCATEETFLLSGLDGIFSTLTLSRSDKKKVTFISTIEHNRFPFYGIAWHPEKNVYEQHSSLNLSRSNAAIEMAHYLARLLVREAQRSKHTFSSPSQYYQNSIFNYCPQFTGQMGYKFEQAYFFQ
ncbi:Peptidase C26 domain containing protein [Trichuris trichiura]|uniref:folate gamma-glutamyl hydrolase n=1 Tax=Trichuris trichiura TaxID=36087 RepID=A0A077ZGE4_TRITR|nr:Peptidase C26 domain containing protein [Trichuris trichiura]